MDFATKMAAMCVIRGINHNQICDKLKIDNAVMALLRKGEIMPLGNLEKQIRCELGWPRESDDLLEEIQQKIYPEGAERSGYVVPEHAPTVIEVTPKAEPIPVVPIVSPITPLQAQALKKKMGRPRKVRPEPVGVSGETKAVPSAIKPPDPFKKRMSMTYLQRPAIGSDRETGDIGALHGSVVA